MIYRGTTFRGESSLSPQSKTSPNSSIMATEHTNKLFGERLEIERKTGKVTDVYSKKKGMDSSEPSYLSART